MVKISSVNIYIETDKNSAKKQKRAFGTIVEFVLKDDREAYSGICGACIATGNQLALIALIRGLEKLNRACTVTVHMENRYVTESIRLGRVQAWAESGWKTVKGKPIANADEWQRLYELMQIHEIRIADVVLHPYRDKLMEKIEEKLNSQK